MVKCLVQGRNNVIRVQVEPRSFNQSGRKNNVFTLMATLPLISIGVAWGGRGGREPLYQSENCQRYKAIQYVRYLLTKDKNISKDTDIKRELSQVRWYSIA